MAKVTEKNLHHYIQKYGIHLEPCMYDEDTEEKMEVPQSWSAFPYATGGVHEDGATAIEAVQNIVDAQEHKGANL